MKVTKWEDDTDRKINAKVQLVSEGVLYHDIGKICNLAFFNEKQHGKTTHESIMPEQSAGIVINHVKDGLKKAEKAKLPGVIKDFITMHHGKGIARYFYNTACNNCVEGEIDVEKYRYPGPNPQTKETAIMMMAAAVEAASLSPNAYNDDPISMVVN